MNSPATCPRCDEAVRAPSIWHSSATCARHGEVVPLQPPQPADPEHLAWVAAHSEVPVWAPWPLPDGWLLTGVRCVRDEHHDARAVVVATSGPHAGGHVDEQGRVGGGLAEMLLVAEQPGTGLGARLAGLDDVDPGDGVVGGAPAARLRADRAGTPLWGVPVEGDRAVLVGEAAGVWLWALLWPASAGASMLEGLELIDLREPGHALDVPCGALTPRVAWN